MMYLPTYLPAHLSRDRLSQTYLVIIIKLRPACLWYLTSLSLSPSADQDIFSSLLYSS